MGLPTLESSGLNTIMFKNVINILMNKYKKNTLTIQLMQAFDSLKEKVPILN